MNVERRMYLAAAAAAALALGVASPSLAEDAPPLLTDPILAAEQAADQSSWVDRVKKPTDWFSWGADVRLRHEQLINVVSLDRDAPDSEWGWQRLRTRIWGTITPADNIDINARLTWEGRHNQNPDPLDEWDERDMVVDNLNLRLSKLFGSASSLTLGRQDIILGDGWLVLEGTPLDGSRTIYFDAARLLLDFEQAKTSVDLIYLKQYSDPDKPISPLWRKHLPQREQDEEGAIVWLTNKSIDNTILNAYFIYKHAERDDDEGVSALGDQGDLYTLGARVVHDFSQHITAKLEGAYQFGNRSNDFLFPGATDNDVSAWGLNSSLAYNFRDDWKNQVRLSFEHLSGDDPGTGRIEQFDPLWGRWPQWSELWVYHDLQEYRVAETTNLTRLAVGWQTFPTDKMQIALDYHLLWADENTLAAQGFGGFSDSAKFRGQLITALLRYKFNRFFSGHLLAESFIPDNYYASPRDDVAWFLRGEIIFTF
jgi:hypothetical protein